MPRFISISVNRGSGGVCPIGATTRSRGGPWLWPVAGQRPRLACGTGRFWDLLTKEAGRAVHAADFSQEMIDVGLFLRPPEGVRRARTFLASALTVPAKDGFVENVCCIRFMHHLGEAADRLALLKELCRISSGTVILSLWVKGNLKA